MKTRNTRLFAMVLAVMMAFSMLVVGTSAAERVDVVVSAPDKPVAKGEKFTVDVKFAKDADLTKNVVAGIQVELNLADAGLAVAGVTAENIKVNEALKTAAGAFFGTGVNDGKIIFVAMKDGFTAASGFTGISNIFSVEVTAQEAIASPYAAMTIKADNSRVVLGDGEAKKIDSLVAKDGSAPSVTLEYATPEEFEFVADAKIGDVEVGAVVSGIEKETTFASFQALYDGYAVKVKKGDKELGASDKIGTGMIIEIYDGETKVDEAVAIVPGDATGDGKVNNTDAGKLFRYAKDSVGNAMDACYQLAGDVNNDGKVNNTDAGKMFRHAKNPEAYPLS